MQSCFQWKDLLQVEITDCFFADSEIKNLGKQAVKIYIEGKGYGGMGANTQQLINLLKTHDATVVTYLSGSSRKHNPEHHFTYYDTAKAGGFRHGKRSQKKNKRTLKSKLTAKKYSLKVGKKKKGKRGNKSKKRRKSIKIRI